MREIKFRAWDETQNKMITDFLMSDGGRAFSKYRMALSFNGEVLAFTDWELANYEESEMTNTSCYVDRFRVMQYTGLHDKNGKEIYEGDIVICTYGKWHEEPKGLTRIGKVVYDIKTCAFKIAVKDSAVLVSFYDTKTKDIEVIGNIYENPNLLERDSP